MTFFHKTIVAGCVFLLAGAGYYAGLRRPPVPLDRGRGNAPDTSLRPVVELSSSSFDHTETHGSVHAQGERYPGASSTVVEQIQTELAKYPATIWHRLGVSRVVVGVELRKDAARAAGVARLSTGTVYLDLTSWNIDHAYFVCTVHHEIFHFIESKLQGDLNARWAEFDYPSPDHPKVVEALKSIDAPFRIEVSGFATAYSMTAAVEDRAELFSLLVCRRSDVELKSARDRVFRRKIEVLLDVLRREFPELNELLAVRKADQ